MALNFGILDPDAPAKLVGSVYAGQQEKQKNMLAQQQLQAGAQQLETGRLQQQHSQMQMDQMIRDRDALSKMQQQFVANGKSPDLEVNADAMIQSGVQHFMDIGVKLKQKLLEQKQFAAIMGGGGPAPATAPVQPAAAPFEPAPGAVPIRQGFAPGTFVTTFDGSGTPVTAPANALAPAPANALVPAAAPTPTPVNALAPQANVDAMRRKRDQLLAMGTTQSIAAARAMDADIALASKEPVYHNVPGVGLVDPRTGRVVTASVEKPAPTTLAKLQTEMSALPPGDPRRAQYAALIKKETTHAPGVTVTNISEKAEQGARGKMLVDQYGDISKAAGLAARTLPSIEVNLSALNKGFDTGFGKETIAAGASVLAALGVKDAEKFATDTQKFQSNAINAVLQKQLEQKGPQTESDARRIEQIGAQLGKTKQANEFILSMAGEQLRRDIDQRNFYDRWYKTNKTYDGAEDAWFAGEGGKSLFDRPGLKKYAGGPSASSQIPSNAPIVSPAAKTIVNPKFPGFSIGKP